MKLIGAWVAVILLLIGTSCRSKSTALLNKEVVAYQQQTSESSSRDKVLTYEHFGDTLRGRVPLPFLQPSAPGVGPLVFPVKSSGIDLEFTLDSTGISYRAVAKPVAKVSIRETETKAQQSSTAQVILKEELKTKEVKQGFPWWLILIGVLLLLSWIAIRVFKSHFKLF